MALREKLQTAGDALSEPGRFVLPVGLINIGVAAWLFIGAVIVMLIAGAFIYLSASVSIPLILAIVVGTVAYPVADYLQRRGIGATWAAAIVLVGLAVIIFATGWLAVAGVVQQWPEIQASVQTGLDQAAQVAADAGFDPSSAQATAEEAVSSGGSSVMTGMLSKVFSSIASGIAGIFGFFFGVFIAVTLTYYILHDYPTLKIWLGSHIGLPADLGDGIVDDGTDALRGYFQGTTATGVVVALTIGGSALLLGVPLALPIALVTFVTCYIPYFGAIFSGAFAFIIALGTTDLTTAVILLIIVLVAQNVLQTVVSARFMGESLSLHPIVVLVVTMLGGTFAGLLGAALAAPLTAMSVRAVARLRAYQRAGLLGPDDEDEDEEGAPAPV